MLQMKQEDHLKLITIRITSLYHVPFYPAFYLGFPNMALGGAERLIEEFKKATEKRVRLMDGMRESESPRSQRVMAEITTQYHTAKR